MNRPSDWQRVEHMTIEGATVYHLISDPGVWAITAGDDCPTGRAEPIVPTPGRFHGGRTDEIVGRAQGYPSSGKRPWCAYSPRSNTWAGWASSPEEALELLRRLHQGFIDANNAALDRFVKGGTALAP